MKTISKVLSTAIVMAVEFRAVELLTLTEEMDRLSSGIIEYEGLILKAKMLEQENRSSEATAVRIVAQNKLDVLAIDYKMAVRVSKFAAFGWVLRRPLITKNQMYKSIREYLGEKTN